MWRCVCFYYAKIGWLFPHLDPPERDSFELWKIRNWELREELNYKGKRHLSFQQFSSPPPFLSASPKLQDSALPAGQVFLLRRGFSTAKDKG